MTFVDLLTTLTRYLTTLFTFLSILFIGPWILALVADVLLYLWRAATYEIPYIGGRARGRTPPAAPTLMDRATITDAVQRPPRDLVQVADEADEKMALTEAHQVRRGNG